jgi:hypothetical protein
MSKYRYTITLDNPVREEDGYIHIYIDDRLIRIEREAPFEFTTPEQLSDDELKSKLNKMKHNYTAKVGLNTLYKNE